MQSLCRFVTGRIASRVILVIALALTALCAMWASRVEQDDNVLEFLPKDNAEVRAFYDVSGRFGSLDVAIAGIAADDVFSKDFLTRLRAATKKLNQTDGIDYALSLTSVEDFTPDPRGGVSTDYLVHDPPETKEAEEALRARVLANENVVGNLVSTDSKGVVVLCFLRHGVDPHTGAAKVRQIVEEAFPSEQKYWGGSPFISTYIYDVTQRDLKKLAPWACIAIIVLIIASFRDVVGMILALASTGMGIVMTLGTMGALHMRSNIVLGSIPVILFALGSAPPVHILTRYYVHARDVDPSQAIVRAMRDKGAVVVASAATVVAGLASFVTMDIAPMRVFGVFTSLGIVLTLVNAIVVVPAAVSVLRLRGRAKVESAVLARASEALVSLARRRSFGVAAMLGLVAVGCALGVRRVDTRMDNAAFFDASSEPARAEAFLGAHFGGSIYVQVLVEGDLENPYVVREVERLGDTIAALPDVAGVNHLGQVLAATNEAMEGVHRLPDTVDKTKLLLSFLTGKRAVSQLVTEDRRSALVNVKLATTDVDRVEKVVQAIENAARGASVQAFVLADARGARGAEVKARGDAFVESHVLALLCKADPAAVDRADAVRKSLGTGSGAVEPMAMREALVRFLRSDEFTGEIPSGPAETSKAPTDDPGGEGKAPGAKEGSRSSSGAHDAASGPSPAPFPSDPVAAVADAVSALPPDANLGALEEAVGRALVRPADDASVKDVAESLERPLADLRKREGRRSAAARVLDAAGTPASAREALTPRVADALADLDLPKGLLPADGAASEGSIRTTVTGLPILYRGLSRSVESNQLVSLLSAAGLVAITMTLLFRSPASGVLSALPALFTIAVVYGGMGLLRIHLDIGTSMLASLIIGAGVDYAIHFLGGWSAPEGGDVESAARQAAHVTGPGVWTNALMVAAGFFVLTLGEARPLKHVGGLTAVAMIAAALSTFLLVPVFARKRSYIRLADYEPVHRPRTASVTVAGSDPSVSESGTQATKNDSSKEDDT
jgi:predicted RND superfamily exporter protein